ncbi:hypothetical protein GCM10025867_13050 [Frondihabitans sucicola]|uniref:Fimbrial assembly protein n=1 Tax=Frondihabitans sucicola TaxID=1268041 RepID=A0ABM8GKZ7_9MICO|nr:hypothetical protein [Frondihabitans sucicola]BDZ49064.1 hypothetical protein GCM10025867_13050 [Frondihabitans sucicola]
MNVTLTRKKNDSGRSTAKTKSAVEHTKVGRRQRPSKATRQNSAMVIGGLPRVDLLPREVRAERRAAAVVRRTWLGVAGVAALVLLASASASLLSAQAKSDLSSAQSATVTLNAQQQKYAKVRTVQNQVNLAKAAQSVGGATEIDWTTYLAKVQASLPDDVSMTSVSLDSASPLTSYAQSATPGQGTRIATVTFIATSASLPSVPEWLDDLTKLPGYVDATPGSVSFAAGQYTANITMHINQAAYSGRFTTKDK